MIACGARVPTKACLLHVFGTSRAKGVDLFLACLRPSARRSWLQPGSNNGSRCMSSRLGVTTNQLKSPTGILSMVDIKSVRVKILPHTSTFCKHQQLMNESVTVANITVQDTEVLRLTAQFYIYMAPRHLPFTSVYPIHHARDMPPSNPMSPPPPHIFSPSESEHPTSPRSQ